MVAWSWKCNIWSYIFLDFHEPDRKSKKIYYLMLNTQFLYQQKAHFILYALARQNFNITICKNFIGPQRSIGPKKGCNFEFQKFIKKQPDHKKKVVLPNHLYWSVLSLEEFWSFIQIVIITASPIFRRPPV